MKHYKNLSPPPFALIIIIAMWFACEQKELPVAPEADQNNLISTRTEGMTVLGEEEGIPYTLENMRLALENLRNNQSTSRVFDDIEVYTSHRYIKFAPKDQMELELLTDDTVQFYSDIPLHYEILAGGTSYHDPNLPDSVPTYQYVVLPADYVIPNVEHEILEELYMPDVLAENDTTNALARSDAWSWVDDLMREAEIVAGTMDEEDNESGARVAGSSWQPYGYVRVYNPVKGLYEGVQGVEVKIKRGLKTVTSNYPSGYDGFFYTTSSFGGDVQYIVKWERYQFEIKDNGGSTACYTSSKTSSWGNLYFGSSSDLKNNHRYFAQIFRGAYHYYYKDIHSLRRPPENDLFHSKMKIVGYTSPNTYDGKTVNSREIYIWDRTRDNDEIYGTTIHELAHTSHLDMIGLNSFNDIPPVVRESWAQGVAIQLVRIYYSSYFNPQTIKSYYTRKYKTGIVEDLIDGIGINYSNYDWIDYNTNPSYAQKFYYDGISGYNISEIETSLNTIKNWEEWKNYFTNKENSDEAKRYIEFIFDHWNSL